MSPQRLAHLAIFYIEMRAAKCGVNLCQGLTKRLLTPYLSTLINRCWRLVSRGSIYDKYSVCSQARCRL